MQGRREKGPWLLPSRPLFAINQVPLVLTGSPLPRGESGPTEGTPERGLGKMKSAPLRSGPEPRRPTWICSGLSLCVSLSLSHTHTRVSQPQAPKVRPGTRSRSRQASPPPPRPSQP